MVPRQSSPWCSANSIPRTSSSVRSSVAVAIAATKELRKQATFQTAPRRWERSSYFTNGSWHDCIDVVLEKGFFAMKSTLRRDIVRVLYEKHGSLSDIRERIMILRMQEQRAGPLRGPIFVIPFLGIGVHLFWRPPERRIKKILVRLEDEDKVMFREHHYQLTDRGNESYHWILERLNITPVA